MSKSKFGNSNLYMTTSEFADLVVQALHEQNYFKDDDVAHPQDIAYAFSVVGETIGNAMSWAIKQEHDFHKEQKSKQAVMNATTLSKNAYYTYIDTQKHSSNTVIPKDDEIALETDEIGYNEWKNNRGYM